VTTWLLNNRITLYIKL